MPSLERTPATSVFTRRRLMAVALASGLGARPALAQSSGSSSDNRPACERGFTHGPWKVGADPAGGRVVLSYNTGDRVFSYPTAAGPLRLLITPLEFAIENIHSPGGPTYWKFFIATFVDSNAQPVAVNYQVLIGGRTFVQVPGQTISPDHGSDSYDLNTDDFVTPLRQSGGVIRLTIAGNAYEWQVDAGTFDEAVRLAMQAESQAEQDMTAGRCVSSNTSDCFVTTVACETIGLPDDCAELQAMRRLRERWLRRQAFGAAMLAWYRESGPRLVRALPLAARPALARFYLGRLIPAVIAVRLGADGLAYRWLLNGIERLRRRYAPDLPPPPDFASLRRAV